jgi:FkbM family methyltransferase
MRFGLDAGQLGMLRSLLMYYAIPFRSRQLARFYAQFIRAGDLCFDIGAHVGNQMRVWSRLGARIIGVEPQPACMRFLKRCYRHHPSITLVEQAVGSVPGTQDLFVSQRTPTVTTLSQEWIDTVQRVDSFAWVRWDTSVAVSVTTLDRLIAEYGRPAFCKIDVEGYELEVLRGLSQPLPALCFEYIPAAMDTALGCIERLCQLGAYEFNWKPAALGESYRLQSVSWFSPDDMAARLKSLPLDGASGDVYARLRI